MLHSAILPEGNTFDFWEQNCSYGRILHVDGSAANASDDNDGTQDRPLRTISRAAAIATPGTQVRIHAGLYREHAAPAMGGTDPAHMICYQAHGDGPVILRASEQVTAFRGHHWVIEDCAVNWSNGVAMDVGNECWHHEHTDGEIIGYSVIRGCAIRDAGVCGIAGLFAKRLLIENNIIEGTGWQKMELSWETGAIKLHDTVETLIRNNIFCDYGEAAIVFPTADNQSEGNLFVNLEGGYLRVMYPAPETCLDLKTWQEFNGFDLTGQNGFFSIQVDEDAGVVTFAPRADAPAGLPDQIRRAALIRDPQSVQPVAADVHVPADVHGTPHGETALPGPFATLGTHPLPGPKACLDAHPGVQ